MTWAMHTSARLVLSILVAGFACGGGFAVACSYDGIASAAALAKFKKAAEVAATLRSPSAAPVIERPIAQPLPSMVGFHRAVGRLQSLREALEQTVLDRQLQAPAIALLLVESGLWTRYVTDSEGVSIAVHVAGPQPSDVLVFTGEAVIEAIMAGRASGDEAFHRGLIVVEGPASGAREATELLRMALAELAAR
jgi:hypothetical protein